jgi:exodeoxyribonuclease V alpha subunit
VLPATIQGIRRYLGSGMIKGIGPMMADRMVTHFGADILTIIEEQPRRLIEVHGLGPKRTKKIADAWEEQKAIKEVMVFLSGVGVSTSLAVRIYKKYRDASISLVRNEPYRLASEVWGIGFKTADTIAQAVGIARDSPERIKAGLQYTLSQAADNGHCYLPQPNLITDATKILEVEPELIGPCLDELAALDGLVREPVPSGDGVGSLPAVYLVPFHRAEVSLASGLLDLLNSAADRLPAFKGVDWDKALSWLRGRTGQDLAAAQQQAVQLTLTSRVAVLTGGPGCGKSFTIRSVVELATAKNATVVLVAPTGRAAKRLAELTGHEASTVHRLLELQPGGDPKYDRDNPLDADLVVVDESSMMDLILANKLIKAIPPGAHLLLVGDVDQLYSVGAGEVLRDLLAADAIPRVRLTQIFRQAQRSGIVVNAHRINSGTPPQLTGFSDFYWFACDPAEDSGLHPAEETAKLVVDIVARRLPAKFGLDPVRDVQVLTPMHRGPAGAGNLNTLLQEALTTSAKQCCPPWEPRAVSSDPAAHSHQSQAWNLGWAHRHRDVSGGWLRPTVFGAVDGLVTNAALIAGVGGGGVATSAIVLTGLVAGAFSMGTGEYVSVTNQNEVVAAEVAVERDMHAGFPDRQHLCGSWRSSWSLCRFAC